MHQCNQCGTEYEANFCPNCGAEYAPRRRRRRTGGLMRAIFRLIGTLVIIALMIIVALIILDYTAFAHNPSNSTAYAVVEGARNLLPEPALEAYDTVKARSIELWNIFWEKLTA